MAQIEMNESHRLSVLIAFHTFSQFKIDAERSHIQLVELELRVRSYKLRFEPRSTTQLLMPCLSSQKKSY